MSSILVEIELAPLESLVSDLRSVQFSVLLNQQQKGRKLSSINVLTAVNQSIKLAGLLISELSSSSHYGHKDPNRHLT